MRKILYTLVVLIGLLGVSENAWGNYYTALRTMVDDTDTGKGLVYANTSADASVTDASYVKECKSGNVQGSNGANQNLYGWAKPARGYVFSKWVSYDYDGPKESGDQEIGCTPKANTGIADLILVRSWSGRAGSDICGSAKASWSAATAYTVTYKQPVGGSYSVEYSYYTVNSSNKFATSSESTTLSPSSENWRPTGATADQEGFSYAADVVTLSTDARNFVGWYEDGVEKSTENPYAYPVTKSANVTALFKWIEPVAPEEKIIRTTNNNADVNESVVFPMDNIVSSWEKADFNVTLVGETGSGTFTLGAVSYNTDDNELTIPFTYNANDNWEEGSSVTIQVAPVNASYGTTASVLVKAIAQENSSYQARVSGEGIATQEGDLTDMLAVANENTDATVTLLNSVAVSSPLVVTKSMTLDLNNWVLSSTAANKVISVEGTDTKLTISDNSFLKGSEIQLTRSANAAIAAIEVTGANRLLYNHGKMTVANNAAFASNANAKAYGIYVSGAGNAVMQGGSIAVESDNDARGVFIASGNATLNVGPIVATAEAKAYALYSGGKINVAEGVSLTATTTTGSDASALYLTGGTAVVDNVAMTATTKTNNAYGVNVRGGKLTLNGGSIAAKATTAGVYGVYIAASGNVTIQQQATITADGPGSSSIPVYGIQNLGILKLINSTVNATSSTNYATAVNSITSAVSTTIEGGTYTAQSATGYAYGLHHQYGALNVDGGTFSATAAGDNVYGARAAVNGTIANATLSGETTGSGKTVYGFVGGEEGKKISLTNCTIKAKSATSVAYAIYTRSSVTATGCELEAKTLSGATACGFYAENGTDTLKNTNATVDSYTTGAYGVNFIAGALTIDGGTFNVTAKQATASSLADSEVYGVKVADDKTANISNASFTVTASSSSWSRKAYGACTGTGVINSKGCTYVVSASQKAYGVYGAASSTLRLQNNTITATTTAGTTAYGLYSNNAFSLNGDKITSNAKTYDSYPLYFDASAAGTIQSGWFKALGGTSSNTNIVAPINTASSNANVKVQGGFFNDIVQLRFYVPNGYDIYGVDPDVADYAAGYYYTVNDHMPYENVCYITEVSTGFPSLEEAFDYARNHSGTNYNIMMIQPYTLPAGNYSLPANATLVVPYKASQTAAIGAVAKRRARDVLQIAENRLLTFASGANLDVYGKIETSAEQYAFNVGGTAYVQGPYGRIHLESGSTITLNSGAFIYAWGYITGQGEIRVKNGATVYEQFQLHDMKGTSDLNSYWLNNAQKTFPVNQYYIQNIEAPTKYYYGSQLYGSTAFTTSSSSTSPNNANQIKIIGTSDYFFNVTSNDESSWVRKRYDATNDRIIWETNSSASLGSMNINFSGYGMDTKDYILPITNNMTVHILSGKFKITQSTVLLPGASLEIDKTATLQINAKDTKDEEMGLYLYDQAQWTANASPVVYSPSWNNGVCPRNTAAASMTDAAIYVKGKIEVDGFIHTTAGGAAIYSDDTNAGTIVFNADATDDQTIYKTYATSTNITTISAKLRNGGISGASFTATKDEAKEEDTYAYVNIDGTGYKWTKLKDIDGGCIIADMTDSENPVYYAKPQGYVAIKSDIEDENHLFHSVVGKRLFIITSTDAGCQWWEVTQVDETSVYHCATNDTYYEWNWVDETDHTLGKGWVEVKRTVTFYFTDPKSEDADKKKVLTVNYGAKPDVSIVSNPSKAEDATATYQFQGWKYGEEGPVHEYTDTDYEPVTENGTYYLPVFTSITKKYTITFKDAKNGEDVPVEVFYGAHPSYNDYVKDPTAQYSYIFLNWTDANDNTYAADAELPEVTGAATYTAHWSQIVNKFTITWKNGDETLQTDTKQPYGTTTAFKGETLPAKATDNNFVYAFNGWRSSLTGQTYANGSTPTVGGETTYEAQYATTPRYEITFANYDGSQLQKEIVTTGEHPVYSKLTPARVRDYDGYYNFTGWKNLSGTFYAKDATLPAVTGKETYTAQYSYVTELYLITLNNVDGKGATWSGKFGEGSTPFYNPNNDDVPVEPTKANSVDGQYEYAFSGWKDDEENEYEPNGLPAVTGVATYTAQFEEHTREYTITWKNYDGTTIETNQEAYGSTPACSITPTKADECNTYAHTGWSPAIQSVTGEATYTAVFSNTPDTRTFAITFDGDNDIAPVVLDVVCGTKPVPDTPEKEDAAFYYTFTGWSDGEHVYETDDLPVASAEVTYTAQYSQTLRSYTVTFVNYDGTPLQSSSFAYGATPTYTEATPTKPVDMANLKKYTYNGWSPAITTVSANATYTATFSETTFMAIVTPETGDPYYATSWDDALNHASNNCTIKLYANVTKNQNTNISIGYNMTIDLNGHTISGSSNGGSYLYLFNVNGKALTIMDSGTGGKISYTGSSRYAYKAMNVSGSGASLTLNSGRIECTNSRTSSNNNCSARAVELASSATLTVNGGELMATSTYGTAYAVYNNGTNVTINACAAKFNATLNGSTSSGSAYLFSTVGNVTASGGYYSKDPGEVTIADGYGKCPVRAEEPEKAAGYTHKVVPAHTITFQNYDGTSLQSGKVEDGIIPTYEGATPSRDSENGISYVFNGWDNEPVTVNADATYTAQYTKIVDAHDSNTPVEVTETAEVTTTTVTVAGTLNISNGATLTTNNLILEASGNASGQIIGEGSISATNAYYDLKLNTPARHWHAFGVPWAVDLNTNPLTEVKTNRTLVLGRDYDIIWYSTSKRAEQGPGAHCWEYVEHNGKTLTPGQGYMIAFTSAVQTVRFVKADGAPIIYNQNVTVSGEGSGNNQGINALANPMAYHATLGAGATVGYVHDGGEIGSDGYEEHDIENKSFIVGKAVYVQVRSDKTVVVAQSNADPISPILAPARRTNAKATDKQYLSLSDYYHVSIASETAKGGSVYVLPEEEKADAYVIGHDLAKFGMNSKKAQLWVNRYDTKLGLNTTAPINEAAEFPVNVYAPNAGEYTISLASQPNDEYTVYLMRNGVVIWDLSNSAYAVELAAGTDKTYGLRLSARKGPAIATDINEAVVDAKGETRKVIINDKVFIIRGNEVYTVDGQLVK